MDSIVFSSSDKGRAEEKERLFLAKYRRVKLIKITQSINQSAMDVLIPEINNSSSTTAENNPTTTNLTATLFDDVFNNCTPLSRVDLVDVFAKMDVGSTEFWGSASVVWMTFFIMYCILFYAAQLDVALFGVFCYWAYVYM